MHRSRHGNWFDEVKRWKPEPLKEISLVVWLNCYGVPLNVWNAETFHSIGGIWGEAINQTIDLDFNSKVFPLRVVVEEHVGVTNFFNVSCRSNKGCDAKTVWPSKSKEKSGGEMGVNVEDMVENSSDNGAEDVNGENKEIHCSNNFHSGDNVLAIEKDNAIENRDVHRGMVDELVSLRNSYLSECQSITSPTPLLRPVMKEMSDAKDRSDELSILGERSIYQAIEKLERRLNR
ncbi:hypothetical protein RHGRI_017147 [Rhododendron griersonianum]|uniref:DUF4283 domain-containing protein n=1 Tax=Rhododendron griersonianum TaxID=479676 RepID=A0AAV6JWT2_9ERIC|nr:hypothetical protein RHGRI_017147 [Rhododendron griersonianum]